MPINLILGLIMASSTFCFAWDDEDDSFGKASSTRRSSLIDYGYGQQRNNYFSPETVINPLGQMRG